MGVSTGGSAFGPAAIQNENPLYALAYPLGALVLLYIFFTAVIRGRRVTWKGRTYISQ